jgi:hypothetical protein
VALQQPLDIAQERNYQQLIHMNTPQLARDEKFPLTVVNLKSKRISKRK